MRILRYVERVARDQTGGVEPIAVAIERNPDAIVELGARNPPELPLYLLRVGIEGGFGRVRAGIPVHRRPNASPHPVLKEIYHCEVAGKRLEAANIHALREKVRAQLEIIAPARSLPLLLFRAPRYDYSLPVYEHGARLVCPVLAGPKLKARGLAELRAPVVRHLRTAGYLDPDEEPDVLVLRPSDLRLVPPAFTIRSLADPDLWIPAVEGSAGGGPVVGLLAHPVELARTRRRPGQRAGDGSPPSAPEVSGLLRLLGAELAREAGADSASRSALFATGARPEIWARTEELTESTRRVLAAELEGGGELEMAIRGTTAGDSLAALRDGESGICVFMAADEDELAAAVGRFLAATGFVRDRRDVRVETIHEPPAETLDPGLIWSKHKEDALT